MLIDRDPPVDWKAVLLDFVRWRWTLKSVADAIVVPPSTLKRWWYDGSEPRFEDGRALLKLHELEKKRHCAPSASGAVVEPIR